jgi:phage I-like protein
MSVAPLNRLLLVSAHSAPLDGQLPTRIIFMPAGRNTICLSVNGQAKQISVNVTRQTASVLQADLEKLLSRTVKPFIDFNHNSEDSAATPKRFVWEEGKGVMLELNWTAAGRSAINGGSYQHFSSTFLIPKMANRSDSRRPGRSED